MSNETLISLSDVPVKELIEDLHKRGYFIARTPLEQRGRNVSLDLKRWSGKKYRFGVVSDTHLCSRYQQLTALQQFYTMCARRRISTVFHSGDLVDGERMYRGHDYEIFMHGYDAQLQYAIDNYPVRKNIQTYMISGNHDQSFFKSAGANIVRTFGKERDDVEYLGDDFAIVNFGERLRIALMHGRGGVAYARSYKLQKIIEQMAPENKPHMLFLGHYHVPAYIPGYRNVEAWQMPCFQAQTPYLVGKGLHPFVGGLIVTVQEDESGLAKVVWEVVPFYQMVKDDF